MASDFNKRLTIFLPLLFALVLVAGLFIGMNLQSNAPGIVIDTQQADPKLSLQQGRVEEVLRYIDAKYVDEAKREQLIEAAINTVLEHLDPHSNYIPAKDLRAINEQLEGNFDGIGIEFMMLDDTIVVVAPLAGGPSEAVGIQAGDKIVSIEDSIIAGKELSNQEIIGMLRGEKGTQVKVGIKRSNQSKLLSFTITRDEIPMHSVDVAYMLDESVGYIKINRFSATTYDEFVQSLEQLSEKQNMQHLVLDLRHNPGGYLQQATNLLSQLFEERGKLLVYTQGRAVNRTDYETNGRAFYNIDDIVVLIDEGSASASEIVAGAIQDHDRGVIIGRRSFGKGLVQEQYPLSDGSALRLTVARYFTPSGRSIQKPYDDLDAYQEDVSKRYESGELAGEEEEPRDSTQKYYTDNGYVVYGGGGISPDIFVPLDTHMLEEDYLIYRQFVPGFTIRHQDMYNPTDLDDFLRTARISEPTVRAFIDYAQEQSETSLPPISGRSRLELKRYLKARFAKQYFGDLGFYTFWNQEDAMVQRSLEVLRKPDPLAGARMPEN